MENPRKPHGSIKTMKILHTIPYFNKASGGPTSCTYQLVKGLNENGVPSEILSFLPAANDILASDDFIRYLPDDRKTSLWLSRNFANELNRIIDSYDLVHINTIWTWPSHIPINKAKTARIPIVVSPHGMLYPQALKVSAWKKKIIGRLYVNGDLRVADCLHATSEEEAKFMRDYGLTNPIAVIPNCLDVSKYPHPRTSSNTKLQFGFTGRLNPIKNIDLLLAAWNRLGDKTTNSHLTLIGDGERNYVETLKDYVKQKQMKNVTFTGFLSGERLYNMIRSLDFQILPSKSENFGMVVPEALICGVPVIASKGTPWSILEERACGWWVDATIDSLANVLIRAMDTQEEKRIVMGQTGRELVLEKFSSDAVARKMKELYDWILGSAEKPSFVI